MRLAGAERWTFLNHSCLKIPETPPCVRAWKLLLDSKPWLRTTDGLGRLIGAPSRDVRPWPWPWPGFKARKWRPWPWQFWPWPWPWHKSLGLAIFKAEARKPQCATLHLLACQWITHCCVCVYWSDIACLNMLSVLLLHLLQLNKFSRRVGW